MNAAMDNIKIIEGEIHHDWRGDIFSINSFRFDDIKRMYVIHHPDHSVIRGWHGHKHERKWFYCLRGEWILALVKIDNWENPSGDLVPTVIHLSDKDSRLVCVPEGYANCLKALTPDSMIQVYSDVPLPEAFEDSWRYDSSFWMDWITGEPLTSVSK